jgi:hypothetical protein
MEKGGLAITIFPQNEPCHQVFKARRAQKCKDSGNQYASDA